MIIFLKLSNLLKNNPRNDKKQNVVGILILRMPQLMDFSARKILIIYHYSLQQFMPHMSANPVFHA